ARREEGGSGLADVDVAVVGPRLAGVGGVPEFEALLAGEFGAVDGDFDEALGGVTFVGGDGRGVLRQPRRSRFGGGGGEGDPGERQDGGRHQGSPRERHKFLFTYSTALEKNLRPSGRTSPPLRVHCG